MSPGEDIIRAAALQAKARRGAAKEWIACLFLDAGLTPGNMRRDELPPALRAGIKPHLDVINTRVQAASALHGHPWTDPGAPEGQLLAFIRRMKDVGIADVMEEVLISEERVRRQLRAVL